VKTTEGTIINFWEWPTDRLSQITKQLA